MSVLADSLDLSIGIIESFGLVISTIFRGNPMTRVIFAYVLRVYGYLVVIFLWRCIYLFSLKFSLDTLILWYWWLFETIFQQYKMFFRWVTVDFLLSIALRRNIVLFDWKWKPSTSYEEMLLRHSFTRRRHYLSSCIWWRTIKSSKLGDLTSVRRDRFPFCMLHPARSLSMTIW